jgi:hypothetical protein
MPSRHGKPATAGGHLLTPDTGCTTHTDARRFSPVWGRFDCRRWLAGAGLAIVALAASLVAADAQAALPRTYDVQRIDSPEPRGGGSFGWGISSADLTADGKHELLVAQSQDATKTQVFIFDGASGAHIDTITPPERNPGGADPILSFVYIETMPDIGSCQLGPGSDRICMDATVGPGDGIPEILAGSRALRVNTADNTRAPVASDPSIGRGYVIDGRTRAVLKRIDMPQADRARQQALNASPQFARVMISPQAMAPCAGSRAENNDAGVGPCPDLPRPTRIGDLDNDGVPDIVITARSFVETRDEAAAGSQCRTSGATPTSTCGSGKAWAYSGAAIPGSSPRAILDTALYAIQNPFSQTTGGGEFGGNLYRIGDVNTPSPEGNCMAPPIAASCAPEFVIPARNLNYPLFGGGPAFSPDMNGVGAAFLFNGQSGANLATPSGAALTSPEPQKLSQFSGSFNGGRAVGDLGATTSPDILLPAAFQNAVPGFTDDGKVWAFNGVGGGGGATGSWQFASATDPTPQMGGNFGGSFTGVGDVVSGPSSPANEVLIGGFHFDTFTEASAEPTDLHFMNVQTGRSVMTIPHPDGARGDGFGVGLTPMGDLNDDGFLDFAASSYLASISIGGDGRAFIFRSNNAPPPPAPTVAPQVAAPAAAAAPAASRTEPPLRPGRCANRKLGTDAAERLVGTIAGDQLFAFAGDDTVEGFQGQDCIDADAGNDTVDGGDASDKLLGGPGNDKLRGQGEHDKLFGGPGRDVLDGGPGRNMLAGGSGNDRLLGGRDADQLFGEGGKDRIVAGGGRNRIDGGAGNDSIEARNGQVDVIRCGRGRDIVRADRKDKLSDCERVSFARKRSRS